MPNSPSIYALLIGINEYESQALRSLQFAVADVLEFREVLHQRLGLVPRHSVQLVTGPHANTGVPSRREILTALDRFSRAPMTAGDTFLLCFAGHGFAVGEQSFLLATDSDPDSVELLRDTAISAEMLRG